MNEHDQEKKLRGLLEEAHRDDRAPSFRRTWDAARQRRATPPWWAFAPAVAAAALLILWSVRPSPTSAPAPHQIPSLDWNAPLDFLLRTPGSEMLSTVPTFDTDWSLR